jgi:TP901 family phage tail tape measure protein
MAGLNTNQILAATPSVLNLAIAGNMDLGRTADITSNILTGFNMEASETAKVADILAQASRSTNVNVEMLGQTMKFIAPAAAAVGGTLAETATLAGVLGDAGIQASMSGVMLRSAYLRLAAPAKSGAKALGKMREKMGISAEEMPDVAKEALLAQKRLSGIGVKIFDKDGKMRSMVTILKEMAIAMKDVSDQEKLSTIKDIFGTRATSGALAIFKSVETGRLDEVEQKINNADGAAEQMANRLRNTTYGAFKEFGSAIESVGISIGSVLLAAFTSFAKGAANMASKISILAEKHPILTRNIGLVIAGLISFKIASIALGFAFTFLQGGILSAKGAMIAFRVAMTLINGVVPVVIGFLKLLKIAVISNPIGLAIAAIATGAFLVIKYWKPISKFFKEIFEGIVGWMQKAFNWVSKFLSPLKEIVNLVGKAVKFTGGIFTDEEEGAKKDKKSTNKISASEVGDVVRIFNGEGINQSNIPDSLTTNNNISKIAGNNSRSNISISSPITINNNGNADERKIADQVKLALDETFRSFDVRKQSLSYDY